MSRDNFFVLILIAVVAFLLFVMNRQSVEGYSNQEQAAVLNNIVANTSSNNNINSQIIDSVGQKIAQNSASNLSILASPNKPINVESLPIDIFKEQTSQDSGVPGPNPTKFQGAGLNMPSTFNYGNLQNSVISSLNSGDLLPADNDVNEYNINKPPVQYLDANLTVNSADKIGVDTIGSSKKNASQDLRGNVPCPKFVVSPWNNSTIDPDTNIKSMYA